MGQTLPISMYMNIIKVICRKQFTEKKEKEEFDIFNNWVCLIFIWQYFRNIDQLKA